jgi:hypothetical protein
METVMRSKNFRPDEFRVRLSILGNDLDPEAVSLKIGLVPTYSAKRGDRIKDRKAVLKRGVWYLDERPTDHWDNFENGLTSMIALLLPYKKKLIVLSATYDVQIVGTIFKEAFDGGPTFSPSLLQKLAKLGLPLSLDCYLWRAKGSSNTL